MGSITHTANAILESRVSDIRTRLQSTKSPSLSLAEAMQVLSELQTFPLGQHLLLHGALDGYWTKYCVADQAMNRKTVSSHGLGPLEDFILNRAPTMLATQERFDIFRKAMQGSLRNGMTIASIPCGFMDDLLSLDYSKTPNVRRVGLDIDQQSVEGALANAASYGLKAEAYVKDAWSLSPDYAKKFDMVTSNGLNIYVENLEREIELYGSLATTLKSGGCLTTSFLTPISSSQNVDQAAAARQKLIFSDVLNVKWQVFRTEPQVRKMLSMVGLKVRDVIYDRQRLFPTVVAVLG